MSEQYQELTVENSVKVRPVSFFGSQNEAIDGATPHLQSNSFITPDKCITFKDDFVGKNGSTSATVPGYPWSTIGSDIVNILNNVDAPDGFGGVWELATHTNHHDQMNLFAGGTGVVLEGAFNGDSPSLADIHANKVENYYKGMKITITDPDPPGGSGGSDLEVDDYAIIASSETNGEFEVEDDGKVGDWDGHVEGDEEYKIGNNGEITTGGGSFQLRKNKDLIFKARFRITSVTTLDCGFFIGLSSNTAKDLISDDCISYKEITSNIDDTKKLSMYGFLASVNGDNKDIKCVAHNNNSPSSDHTGDSLTDDDGAFPVLTQNKWYTCTILITHDPPQSGADFQVKYILKREATGETGENIPKTYSHSINIYDDRCMITNQTPMAPAISIKKGSDNASAPIKYQIDYIECHQKR